MTARLLQQHAVKGTNDDDREAQLHDLLDKPPASPPPLFTELGVLVLVPVCMWCLVSWALSYAGSYELLAKFSLFAFIPAVASVFACERIRQLRIPPSELTILRDENDGFKKSNAELKAGVDLLRAENEEARSTNCKLESSVADLEDVRATMEKYAEKQGTDFGQVLEGFKKSLAQQQRLLEANAEIQQRTRKLAEAQWRGLLLNLYAQAKESASAGMTRREFKLWLAMLPGEISSKLSDETFENIDSNGDDCIDVSEMCNFVQGAVNAHLNAISMNGELMSPAALPTLSVGLSSVCSEDQAAPCDPVAVQADDRRRVGFVDATAGSRTVDSNIPASTVTGQGHRSPRKGNDVNDSATAAHTHLSPGRGARPKFSDSYMQRLFGSGSTTSPKKEANGEQTPFTSL